MFDPSAAARQKAATSPESVRDVARLVRDGTADVTAIADELRGWCL
ncbi:hypothetical protein AB0910_10370 [Streptomyces sp. NPDC047002]